MHDTRITDTALLEEFLRPFPVENAYMLGYLDPAYEPECRWYARVDDEGVRTLVLIYEGLSRPAMFVTGRADGVAPLLKSIRNELPQRVLGRSPRGLLDAVKTAYQPGRELLEMQRMGLNRSTFQARDKGGEDPIVEVLSHRDTGAMMKTYAFWPDHFFEPYQLSSGLYFGIRGDEDGVIASIAGIHNLSERYDVAAIGNLVTHPDYRGRGYARRCTAVLLRHLFERVGLVTLDVQAGNAPAIRTYQHFGFQQAAEYFEGEMTLRS